MHACMLLEGAWGGGVGEVGDAAVEIRGGGEHDASAAHRVGDPDAPPACYWRVLGEVGLGRWDWHFGFLTTQTLPAVLS